MNAPHPALDLLYILGLVGVVSQGGLMLLLWWVVTREKKREDRS